MIEEIQRHILYNAESGLFTWIKPHGSRIPGKVGETDKDGYLIIYFKGKRIKAHRLAWFLTYGELPKQILDHIDGNKCNNRISNLRISTNRLNQINRKIHRDGHLAGTTFSKRGKKWVAQIQINSLKKTLGKFDTQLEAHEAYMNVLESLTNEK